MQLCKPQKSVDKAYVVAEISLRTGTVTWCAESDDPEAGAVALYLNHTDRLKTLMSQVGFVRGLATGAVGLATPPEFLDSISKRVLVTALTKARGAS